MSEETISNQTTDTQPVTPTPITEEGLNDILGAGTYTDSTIVAENIAGTEPINTPVPVTPTTPVEPTQPIIPTEPIQPTGTPAPIQPQTTFTQADIDRIVAEREIEIGKKYEALNAFMEEWKANPYGVMSKSAPHLFQQFDEIGYVNSKLQAEFGEFTPDPAKVYLVGTEDWKYVQRQNALLTEAQDLKNNVVNTVTQNQTQVQESLEQYKTTKAQSLGMTPDAFNSLVWNKVEAMKDNEVLDVIVNSLIAINKLGEVKDNLNRATDISTIPPSPTSVAGAGTPVADTEIATITELFGTKDF